MAVEYQSWGRYPRVAQTAARVTWRDQLPGVLGEVDNTSAGSLLPYGNGRSYGDSCLSAGDRVIATRGLGRLIAFDPGSGVVRCESGVLLGELLPIIMPRGWFLPVTPGTRFVTVGGAIANDVHGKNHHTAGCFGNHVRAFELLRSDGRVLTCSRSENPEWFRATIGGLGLTGVVSWAEIQLKPIASRAIRVETVKFGGLDDFFQLSEDSDRDFEYTVAWVDCLARGSRLGRGHFMRGDHAHPAEIPPSRAPRHLSIPFDPPFSLINQLSLKLFNTFYYHRQRARRQTGLVHHEPFFYPLDAVGGWNRIYGPRGFQQYQCMIPAAQARDALNDMLGAIARSGTGSFLAVLKVFGGRTSPGLLSFPRPGATLALDFPHHGRRTAKLFETLDRILRQAGGRLYPAKDAHMTAEDFQAFYPQWRELESYRDPALCSAFWRRVTGSCEPNG
jgi:FAD/FMN-containing dehydrogenase